MGSFIPLCLDVAENQFGVTLERYVEVVLVSSEYVLRGSTLVPEVYNRNSIVSKKPVFTSNSCSVRLVLTCRFLFENMSEEQFRFFLQEKRMEKEGNGLQWS